MSQSPLPAPGNEPDSSRAFQQFQHAPVGTRVPEKIGRGVFSTGLLVLQTHELLRTVQARHFGIGPMPIGQLPKTSLRLLFTGVYF